MAADTLDQKAPRYIIANRSDQLGGRLIPILNGLRMAQKLGSKFLLTWKVDALVGELAEIFSGELIEPFDPVKAKGASIDVTHPLLKSAIYTIEDTGPPNGGLNNFEDSLVRPVFSPNPEVAYELSLRFCSYQLRKSETSSQIADDLFDQFRKIPKTDAVLDAFDRIDRALSDRPVGALHVRRLHLLANTTLQINRFESYCSVDICNAAMDSILQSSGPGYLLLASDSRALVRDLKRGRSRVIILDDVVDGTGLTRLQQAMIELYFLSKSPTIYGPASAFGLAAAIIGGGNFQNLLIHMARNDRTGSHQTRALTLFRHLLDYKSGDNAQISPIGNDDCAYAFKIAQMRYRCGVRTRQTLEIVLHAAALLFTQYRYSAWAGDWREHLSLMVHSVTWLHLDRYVAVVWALHKALSSQSADSLHSLPTSLMSLDTSGQNDRTTVLLELIRAAVEMDCRSFRRDDEAALGCFFRAAALAASGGIGIRGLLLRVSQVFESLGRPREKLSALSAAVIADPTYADSHFALAEAMEAAEQLEAAKQCFRRATELEPSSGTYWYAFGQILCRLGQEDVGQAAIQEAALCEPHRGTTVDGAFQTLHPKFRHATTKECAGGVLRRKEASAGAPTHKGPKQDMPARTDINLGQFNSLQKIKERYHLPVTGIVHVGASVGQEVTTYAKSRACPVLYVEPVPAAFDDLSKRLNDTVGHSAVCACCWDSTGLSIPFYISSNQGLSSSAFRFGKHASLYPEVYLADTITVSTIRLDDLIEREGFNFQEFNYLNVDAQECDLRILQGAPRLLSLLNAVQVKVSVEPLYEGGCTLDQIVELLEAFGFKKEVVQIFPKGWGEALFLKSRAANAVARNGAAHVYRVPRDFTKPESRFLLGYRNRITSELGEDGILAAVFERIGVFARWCVEAAAGNGKKNSNVYALWNAGWSACLVENDQGQLAQLREATADQADVHVIEGAFENLDADLMGTGLPTTYDVLSLDVRGNEWQVWDSHAMFRPRVVCVGFNPSFPNDVYFVQAQNAAVHHGSSLLALISLGKKKGYELIATTEWNAIFVEAEEFPKFGIVDNSIYAVHAESESLTSSFYQLYDGTIGLAGCDSLIWKRKALVPQDIQVLPRQERSSFSRVKQLTPAEFAQAAAKPTIFLTATGGLVNRLMAVVSCLRLAELFHRRCRLQWPHTYALNCDWQDLFATPIESFTPQDVAHIPEARRFNLDATRITDAAFPVPPVIDFGTATLDICVNTNSFLGHSLEARGNSFWNYTRSVEEVGRWFDRLRLAPAVQERLDEFLALNGPVSDAIGLHVRRGSGDSERAQAYFGALSDEDYAAVADSFAGGSPVLLASDSMETRSYLRERFDARLLTYTPRSLRKGDEPEAIQDALIDFLLLSRCRMVLGVRGSSFSFFASQLRCVPYVEVANPRPDGTIELTTHRYRDDAGAYDHRVEVSLFPRPGHAPARPVAFRPPGRQ